MKGIRRTGDGIDIELEPGEMRFLKNLPQLVRSRLIQSRDKPLVEGPFPADDHELLCREIQRIRDERLAAYEHDLSLPDQADTCLHIPDNRVDSWLGFLNDVRMMLAAELPEPESWHDVSDTDPHRGDKLLLHYLSWIQGAILSAGCGIDMRESWTDDET